LTEIGAPRTHGALPRVEYRNGLHLEGTLLWFDARRTADLCFVSSAGAPPPRAHMKVLCTDKTARFLRKMQGAPPALVCPFRKPFALGSLTIELLPAGSVLGSASLRCDVGGHRVLYAGAANPRGTPTAEPARLERCDVLVLDTTWAAPRFAFPDYEVVAQQLVREIDAALGAGQVPVVLLPPVGVAQDLLRLVGQRYTFRAQAAIGAACAIYRAAGVDLVACKNFVGTPAPTGPLLWPLHLAGSVSVRKIPRKRLIALTPLALEPGWAERARVDVAIPWSNLPDATELRKIVERTHPRKIYVHGGDAEGFAASLRAEGLVAEEIVTERQGTLL